MLGASNVLTTTDCIVLPIAEPTAEAEKAAIPFTDDFFGKMQSEGTTLSGLCSRPDGLPIAHVVRGTSTYRQEVGIQYRLVGGAEAATIQ